MWVIPKGALCAAPAEPTLSKQRLTPRTAGFNLSALLKKQSYYPVTYKILIIGLF